MNSRVICIIYIKESAKYELYHCNYISWCFLSALYIQSPIDDAFADIYTSPAKTHVMFFVAFNFVDLLSCLSFFSFS